MARNNFFLATLITSCFMVVSAPNLAQDSVDELQCGVSPTAPEVVDGSSTTMEELVANSKAVQGFIAEADEYLDCQKEVVNDTTNGLSREERNSRTKLYESLVLVRNEIGDLFNAEIAEYRAANPE